MMKDTGIGHALIISLSTTAWHALETVPEIFGATIILHIKVLCACLEHDLLSDIRNKRGQASFCDTDNVIIADDSISCEVANTMYALQHNISLLPSKSICIKIILIG
jgi:hypothetical protein